MGSRIGFEYRYCFRVDDEIVSRYGSLNKEDHVRVVFEIRTNFVIKGKFDDDGGASDEKLIDAERYGAIVLQSCDYRDEEYLQVFMGRRLQDYWMSDDEIQELIHRALAFAKQSATDSQHSMIPIAVNIDVCTVQQKGEPINATMDRAIMTQYLYPINLCPVVETSHEYLCALNEASTSNEMKGSLDELLCFLRELSTTRVEDVDKESSLMEVCPICLRRPTIGAQISSLRCKHAFHNHCIVQWLHNNNSCPMCRQQAHDREF